MACIQKSETTLRIFGDDLIPSEVSKMLGCEPTKATQKGEVSGDHIRKYGSWRLCAPPCEPENIDHQVSSLLDMLTDNPEVWRHLGKEFKVDLFCGLFMGSSNEGFSLSPATMLALANRGVEIGFDIYGSSE